jgi:hypothetical protein
MKYLLKKTNKLSDGKFSRKRGSHIYFCVRYNCNVSKFNAVNLFGEKPGEIIKANAVQNNINLCTSAFFSAWTMTKKEGKALLIFERKIFGRIYGAKYEDWE